MAADPPVMADDDFQPKRAQRSLISYATATFYRLKSQISSQRANPDDSDAGAHLCAQNNRQSHHDDFGSFAVTWCVCERLGPWLPLRKSTKLQWRYSSMRNELMKKWRCVCTKEIEYSSRGPRNGCRSVSTQPCVDRLNFLTHVLSSSFVDCCLLSDSRVPSGARDRFRRHSETECRRISHGRIGTSVHSSLRRCCGSRSPTNVNSFFSFPKRSLMLRFASCRKSRASRKPRSSNSRKSSRPWCPWISKPPPTHWKTERHWSA